MDGPPESGVDPGADVLLAEDEPDLADLYARWLDESDLPVTVDVVGDGTAALDALGAGTDLLVCNRGLPAPSGDEVIAWLPETAFGGPVVALSGRTPDLCPLGEFADRPIPDGRVAAYLVKPVRRETLLSAVREALPDLS